MYISTKNNIVNRQSNSSGISFLEQNYSKLSIKEQSKLIKYLQSLVSLQNTITGTDLKKYGK
jgi:hypothetical protein